MAYNVSDTMQVEVIDLDSKVVRTVHENYYLRNRHRLIPTDEYYVHDMDSNSMIVNQKRVAETLKLREEEAEEKEKEEKKEEVEIPEIESPAPNLEELIEDAVEEVEEALEAVDKVKKARAKRKTTRKKSTAKKDKK